MICREPYCRNVLGVNNKSGYCCSHGITYRYFQSRVYCPGCDGVMSPRASFCKKCVGAERIRKKYNL